MFRDIGTCGISLLACANQAEITIRPQVIKDVGMRDKYETPRFRS
jgi:hypothetical protein